MGNAKYALGVDLGTTHTVLASAPLDGTDPPRIFPVRQRISSEFHEARALLPSFLVYDAALGAWEVGERARAHHALAPDAVVASSKSWLTEARVDRTSSFLPLATDLQLEREPDATLSPAEAQVLILRSLEGAWNAEHPDAPFGDQSLVVTIPASFDPFARELVLKAARSVAKRATLLEEPTAALLHVGDGLGSSLLEADAEAVVFVADVGGGTTDFALIRVLRGAVGPVFERIATGRHLLLGGDNVDLALAHRVAATHEPLRHLPPRAFASLVVECRRAKESLLENAALSAIEVRVVLPGGKLVGGLRTGTVTRHALDECVLRDFFPLPGELVAKPSRSAFLGFGLSYERDPAITRHAHEFLERALVARPLVLLPNGGSLKAPVLVRRLAEALRQFGHLIDAVLPGEAADVAVALGAARHARDLAHGAGRLRGRVPRNLFLRVQRRSGDDAYIGIVASGTAENEERTLEVPELALRTGERARFELAWSDGPPAREGAIAQASTSLERLPSLTVDVPPAEDAEVPVSLRLRVDDLGCLHLACVSAALRKELTCTFETRAKGTRTVRQARLNPAAVKPVLAASPLLEAAFPERAGADGSRAAKELVRGLEGRLGPRKGWSLSICRALADILLPRAVARRATPEQERVFWQLAGFLLRPGLGADGDDERMDRLFGLEQERIVHGGDARAWEAYFHAWRRVAMGLDARRQGVLFERGEHALGLRRSKKTCPHVFDGSLAELVGRLDRVDARRRVAVGDALFDRCMAGEAGGNLRRCLGLLGEREPFPAGHEQALPALVVERWSDLALRESWSQHPEWVEAAARMGRRTGDRRRDVSSAVRERLTARLGSMNSVPGAAEALEAVTKGGAPNVRVRLADATEDVPLGLLFEG